MPRNAGNAPQAPLIPAYNYNRIACAVHLTDPNGEELIQVKVR